MTCHEFWDEMPELQPGPELFGHAKECPACASRLERQRALVIGLKRVAAEQYPRQAPAHVEDALVKAFRAQSGLPAQGSSARRWLWWSAAAAVIIVGFFLIESRRQSDLGSFQVASEQLSEGLADSEFIPLPYATESEPSEDSDLVRLQVPRTALVALGLSVPVNGFESSVEAVVALGADGTVQGVRLVQ